MSVAHRRVGDEDAFLVAQPGGEFRRAQSIETLLRALIGLRRRREDRRLGLAGVGQRFRAAFGFRDDR